VLDLELHHEMIRRGYWIAYDDLGMNIANGYITDANDERRVAWLSELLRRDLAPRILVSHDVWCKIQLAHFGGGGYTYIQEVILPWLRREGASEAQLLQLTVGNPAAFFPRSSVVA
jgi:predicted metal-dependent phosphotriesterase family hydrolase